MTGKAYAQCRECDGDTFRYVDEDTEGDYPSCRFVCTRCGRVSTQLELNGIEWIEVPF